MKKIFLIMFTAVLGLALAGCGGGGQGNQGSNNAGNDEGDSNKDTQLEKTEINVGTNPTFPPFETKKGSELIGFDIALVKAIAKEEDLEVQFNSLPFDGLISSLQTGQIDMAIAGMSISEKRMKGADFSDAYYKSGLSIVTNPDSGIKKFADLKGKIVGTQKGTTSVSYMKDHGVSSSNIKQYDNITAGYSALKNGGVDAVLYDNPVNVNYLDEHKTDAKVVGKLLTGEYYGMAVSKEKPDLVKKLNDGLEKLRENGEYEKLFDEYLAGDKRGLVKESLSPEEAVK